MYSIVIPYRNEPLLDWTIKNVLDQVPDAEIITLEDEPMVGIGYRRDQGIKMASFPIVFLLDAHMGFEEGFFHSMASLVEANRKVIACSKCRSLNDDLTAGLIHGKGAYVYEVVDKSPFVSRWNQGEGQPEGLLGGAYVLNRDWYMNGLNRPWRYHRFWGKSEQIIGIINWMMGGRNVVNHEVWSSHMFKDDRKTTGRVMNLVRLNAYFILHCLCDDESRERIMRECYGANLVPEYGMRDLSMMGAIDDVQTFVRENAVRDYSSFPFG